MSFVKLHGTILDSSIWSQPHYVRIVWITMLAMADMDGIVSASVDGLARRAVVTIAECEKALQVFMSPDPHSRDGSTGERIEKVPGGWLILNHAAYREKRTPQQIATAARVARHRARKKCNDVTVGNGKPPSDADAEAEEREEEEEEGTLSSEERDRKQAVDAMVNHLTRKRARR